MDYDLLSIGAKQLILTVEDYTLLNALIYLIVKGGGSITREVRKFTKKLKSRLEIPPKCKNTSFFMVIMFTIMHFSRQ